MFSMLYYNVCFINVLVCICLANGNDLSNFLNKLSLILINFTPNCENNTIIKT